jgi:threonine dehydrogenase-like Zn-dependent dehydrogenase
MRAITVWPGVANSARLDDIPEPPLSDGAVLVRAMALGVCGTDREIISGSYGYAPPGQQRLVLGHESLGEIKAAPAESGLAPGDLIVGIVRRPDPVPCPACAMGEWDMCRNGRYTERGIKERHGYGVERFRIEPEFAVKIDPTLGLLGVLLEPAASSPRPGITSSASAGVPKSGRRRPCWSPAPVRWDCWQA